MSNGARTGTDIYGKSDESESNLIMKRKMLLNKVEKVADLKKNLVGLGILRILVVFFFPGFTRFYYPF